ncbi:putative GNAT family acetyltransferase [Rhypophila decipiens]|uniref:GNAT family acetyltransferase n=1 Tax=Rhypophila decipiens TaxID=261697 RepID=A0AAN7B5P4_9PEZI|nr:putative GNAT family acetyltransferase [Rhypophila decipiens]
MGVLTRSAFSYSSRVFFPLDDSLPNPEEQEQLLRKDEEKWREVRIARRWQDGCPVFLAEDTETGRVVGVAQWKPPKGDGRWKREGTGLEDMDTEPPASMDVKKYDEVMAGVGVDEGRALKKVGLEEENCWYLMTIATTPDQKRRGIGKMLMQWGLDQAKADKRNVFLTATDEGKFLYEKVGFKLLDEFEAAGKTHYAMMLFNQGDE